MNYFTPDWHGGGMAVDAAEAVVAAYGAHLQALAPTLPAELRTLATQISLHDGLIRQVTVVPAAECLTLGLRAGNLGVGYFDIDIRYTAVDAARLDREQLAALADDPRAELLYCEYDRESDGLVHRMLWWVGGDDSAGPYRELEIRFGALTLQRVARADREFPSPEQRYVEFA